jgi:uncharacterized tellurite resistance protein B-like protein
MPYRIIAKPILESFIDNVLRKKVVPKIGSIVYCDLFFNTVEHSGVYIGNNTIVHLDGSGIVEAVSPEEFLSRLGGLNTAISIYISCLDDEAVGNEEIAQRAKNQIGTKREYDLFNDNCHQFTSGCITGNYENNHNFFASLKGRVETYLGSNCFRVWDRDNYNLHEEIKSTQSILTKIEFSKKEIFNIELIKFTSLLIHYILDKQEILPSDIYYFEKIMKEYFPISETKVLKDMYELRNKIKYEDIKELLTTFFLSFKDEEQKTIEDILSKIVNQDEKGKYCKYRDIYLILHKLKKEK